MSNKQDITLWQAQDEDDISALVDYAQEQVYPEPAPTPEPPEEEQEDEEWVDEDEEGNAETEEGEWSEYEEEDDTTEQEAGGGEPARPIRSCFRCLDDYEYEPGQDYCLVCRVDPQLQHGAGQSG